MKNVKNFVGERSILAYFLLTFFISWGGIIVLGAPHGIPTTHEQFQRLWPLVFLPYLLGPILSSFILTGIIDGKAGFRHLFSRLLRWRVKIQWYAIALLTAPVLVVVILSVLSLASPAYLPAIFTTVDKSGLLLLGVAVGFFGGGLMEEPGWTGFAVPRLRQQFDVLSTGLIVGFLWGVWHFLPTYWGSGDSSGALSLSLLLPPCFFYLAVLPAYRVLMVWVHDRTESLLLVVLMHSTLTASTLFVLSPSAQGIQLCLYYLILAAVLWVVVVAIRVMDRGQPDTGRLSRARRDSGIISS